MEIIENNPFRVLGLPITASVREIDKRATELETYASMGKPKTYDTDFNFKPALRTLETITEARKKLQLDEEKFRHSLFWFWNNNSVDDLALDLLRDGDIEKAKAIWEKAVFANSEDVYIPVAVIEDLISETKWSTTDNDDWRTEKEDDYFVIEKRKDGSMFSSQRAEFEDAEKWLIECDCEWMSGAEDSPFGVVFGREGKNFFTFNISANGSYSLFRYVDWKLEKIVDWTDSDTVNGYGTNHLEIQRNRDEIILRINDEEVERIERKPFFGQHFGFYVHNIQTVHFSNLRLSKIKKDERYAIGISVSNKNVSCVKNLSLLQLYHSISHGILKSYSWEPSISLFEKFISSEYFGEYAKSVAGEKFVLNRDETIDYYNRLLVESLKPSLNKTYGVTTQAFIDSFSVFPEKNFQAVKNLFVAGSIQKINKAVSKAEGQRKADATKTVDSGKELISCVENEIVQISKTLGASSIEYQLASDKVVDELILSGIAYCNAAKDDEPGLPLYKYATTIAVTPEAIERAKENLRSCELSIPLKNIHKLIEKSQNFRQASPRNAISTGQNLIAESKVHLNNLKASAGSESDEFRSATHYLVHEIVQCGIAHFNSTKNDEPGLPLYQYAVSLATSSEDKKYVNENLASCKEWIKNKAYLLCHFCGRNEPKIVSSIDKTMYLETHRSYFPRSVEFSYGDVSIPRCKECESIHTAVSNYHMKTAFTIIGSGVFGFVVAAILTSNLQSSGLATDREQRSFVIGAVFAIVMGIVGWGITRKFFTKVDAGDIRKASDIGSYPPVRKRLSEGWSFSKPSA